MSAAASLIDQLDAVEDPDHRLVVFRKIEALFLSSGLPGSDERTGIFDEALSRLSGGLDGDERAAFARRIADGGRYLPLVIGELADDDDISVAGPVLESPMELGEDVMLAVARKGDDNRLMSLARRNAVPERVTDVMVRRGGDLVMVALAENPGARFSVSGFLVMSEKSGDNPRLGALIVARHDFRRMVTEVGATDPSALDGLPPAVAGPAMAVGRERDAAAARKAVELLRRSGKLDEPAVAKMAAQGAVLKTLAALSQMAGRPVDAARAAETAASLGMQASTVAAIRTACARSSRATD